MTAVVPEARQMSTVPEARQMSTVPEARQMSTVPEARQREPADRFTMDVLREGFAAITDEMFVSLQRTSQSPIIYEVLDFASRHHKLCRRTRRAR